MGLWHEAPCTVCGMVTSCWSPGATTAELRTLSGLKQQACVSRPGGPRSDQGHRTLPPRGLQRRRPRLLWLLWGPWHPLAHGCSAPASASVVTWPSSRRPCLHVAFLQGPVMLG